MATTISGTNMAHTNVRLLDAYEERLNTLTPLRGYAMERLVSLKEAVVKVRQLVDDVDSRVWAATNRCKNPTDKLTQDESAAIVLYTIEWDRGHPSLYSVLNQTLRIEDRRKLIPWFPYLKLLFTALFKLSSICCTVWRGVRGDLRSSYKVGDNVTWWAFSSCTTAINVLESDQYLGISDPRTLFAIECLNGKDIKRHSYFAQEEEILLLPCAHFEIISQLSSTDNLYIIHLREVTPPFMLLEPPNPQLAGLGAEKPDYEQLQSELWQLASENESLKIQCNKFQAEHQISNKNYEDMIMNLKIVIQRLQHRTPHHKEKIKRLEEDNERLKIQYDQHRAQINDLQTENQTAIKNYEKIKNLQEEIQRLEQDNDHLKIQCNQQQVQIKELRTENQMIKKNYETELKNLKQEIQHLNSRLKQGAQQFNQEIEHRNKEIQLLRQEIDRQKLSSAASIESSKTSLTTPIEHRKTPLAASFKRSSFYSIVSKNTTGITNSEGYNC